MYQARVRPAATLALITVLSFGLGPTLAAQAPTRSSAAVSATEAHDANETRRQLMDVLEQYAPELGRVLKLDPSLLTNQAYLAPYPSLATFLTQHPEVTRSPAYFFESISVDNNRGYRPPSMWEDVMAGVAVLTGVAMLLLCFGWVIRTVIDYRRWHRLSKTQSEAHAKLLDRFTANDEVLAYVQSPAGSRFLQSAPITLDPGARNIGAPFSRILWSVQAGLVLALGGLGLQYISSRVTDESKEPFFAMGVLAVALGAGFILSAAAAYFLSRKLGLFDAPTNPPGSLRHDPPALLRDERE